MSDGTFEIPPMSREAFRVKWGRDPDFEAVVSDDLSEEEVDCLRVALSEGWDRRVAERN
jgi:hypothetical protein